MNTLLIRFFAFSLLAFLTGCGGGDVIVSGKVFVKGEQYKPANDEQMMIVFGEETNGSLSGKTFPTRVTADGSFQIAGPDNVGIKPGKYKVGVTSVPERPQAGKAIVDKFGGKYDLKKSTITVDVSSSNRDLKIELQ